VDETPIEQRIDKERNLMLEANAKDPYNHEEYEFHRTGFLALLDQFIEEYIEYGMPHYYFGYGSEHVGSTLSAEDVKRQLQDYILDGDCCFAEAIELVVHPFERAIKYLRESTHRPLGVHPASNRWDY